MNARKYVREEDGSISFGEHADFERIEQCLEKVHHMLASGWSTPPVQTVCHILPASEPQLQPFTQSQFSNQGNPYKLDVTLRGDGSYKYNAVQEAKEIAVEWALQSVHGICALSTEPLISRNHANGKKERKGFTQIPRNNRWRDWGNTVNSMADPALLSNHVEGYAAFLTRIGPYPLRFKANTASFQRIYYTYGADTTMPQASAANDQPVEQDVQTDARMPAVANHPADKQQMQPQAESSSAQSKSFLLTISFI